MASPPTGRAPRRPLSRTRLLVFSALATLLVFGVAELALRTTGALVQSRHRARTDLHGGSGDLRVVAAGDSYTFGIGADDPAQDTWAMVVAKTLEERTGRAVQLDNLATPGANSTEIVDALVTRLDAGPVDVVLLLAGVNNSRWLGQSGQFCLEEGTSPAQRVRDRLDGLRTYAVLRHLVLSRRPPRDADVACRRVADGFQHLDDGYPDRADRAFSEALALNPASGWANLGLGLADLRVARHDDALQHIDAARALGVSPPALALASGFALRAADRTDEARAIAAADHHGDLAPFGRVLDAWLDLDAGRSEAAIHQLERVLADLGREGAPGGPAVWALDALGWARLDAGDAEGARAAFDESITLGATLHMTPHLMGWSHVGRAVLAAEAGDPGQALVDLEAAGRDSAAVAAAQAYAGWLHLTRGSRTDAQAALERSRVVTPGLAIADALEEAITQGPAGSPPRPRPVPGVAVQQWVDPADTRLVEADLERAARHAEATGALLILTTYPQPRGHPELADAAAGVGERTSALYVDPRPLFQAERDRIGSWEPLLIPDGHPTTMGYRLLGGLVADAIDSSWRQ